MNDSFACGRIQSHYRNSHKQRGDPQCLKKTEARAPLPMIPGNNRKTDSEYVRNGSISIFAFTEPLGGTHHVSVQEHRTTVDWTEEISICRMLCILTRENHSCNGQSQYT